MSDIIIRVENLGKKYTIGHQAENGRYVALRDVLVHNAKNLWNKTKDLVSGKPIIQGDTTEEVWALKDISFDIKQGEAVGIIGRNGAGKSTLLKILSRITEPTTGRVTIKGRVASLLEVGTGFHPELTGRENIYLNGTILGMTRTEIKRKFDEIVAFAEIEKYLDTPVKRYSSGMYTRLAFAVAAHMEPEILIVDEVLAVGDAQFQKKCLGKMEEVGNTGRTVLFVSHNMASLQSLCRMGIILHEGQMIQFSEINETISRYNGLLEVKEESSNVISIQDMAGKQIDYWPTNEPCSILISLNRIAGERFRAVDISLWANDVMISSASSDRLQEKLHLTQNNQVLFSFPTVPLTTKKMHIDLAVRDNDDKYIKLNQKSKTYEVEPNHNQFYFDHRLITQFPVKCEVRTSAL